MSWKWALVLPLAALVLSLSMYTVDAAEYVYLTQFGRLVAVLDGSDPFQAGLHLLVPPVIQHVVQVDVGQQR